MTDPLGRGRDDRRGPRAATPRTCGRRSRADGTFVYLDRQVDSMSREELEALQPARGSGSSRCRSATTRPGPLASQVLGFVNVDGVGCRRARERATRRCSRARPGSAPSRCRPTGCRSRAGSTPLREPVPGAIDASRRSTGRCSSWRRRRCERAVKENGAQGGTVVVMDPPTGDVLRDGDLPVVRPERLQRRAVGGDAQPRGDRRLRAGIGQQDHHGGGRAGDRGGDASTERFRVPARCRSGPFTIHDSHVHPVESMTIGDIIAESSNIGARAGRRAGGERAARRLHASGSGTAARPGSGSRARRQASCCRPPSGTRSSARRCPSARASR